MELREPLPFPADAGFELIEEIGRGGSGIVYAVRWQGKKVALKLPQADLGERDRTHFLREATLLQRAAHPGVVEVLDAGTLDDGRPYLVMPLLRGESLAEHIARKGKIPVDEALGLFLPLAEAVAHLHSMGLAHRDIKPENVYFLEDEHRLLLLDFGIARETDKPPSTTTQANIVRGTPATMAPERFFGARATASSDAYELALILYTMLAGALPWGESTDASERLSPKAPSEMGAAVPEAVDRAILEALSTRPERRPTVRALVDRLSNQSKESSSAARTTVATKPPAPDHDLPSEEEALRMLASTPSKRATKATSIPPADRTTGESAEPQRERASMIPLIGAVIGALGVGALVATLWTRFAARTPTVEPQNTSLPVTMQPAPSAGSPSNATATALVSAAPSGSGVAESAPSAAPSALASARLPTKSSRLATLQDPPLAARAAPPKCTPFCPAGICGDDGCGGSCATCAPPYTCVFHSCQKNPGTQCGGVVCGSAASCCSCAGRPFCIALPPGSTCASFGPQCS